MGQRHHAQGYMVSDSPYITRLNDKVLGMEDGLVFARGWGWGGERVTGVGTVW